MKKLPIVYGAMVLTGVNLLLRFVGTSFQVYLSGRIGPEGIGLLQLVMSVGSMALVAGTAGIRTGTMYLSAEEIGRKTCQNLKWVLSGCILYSIVFSILTAAAVYIFAPIIAVYWIGNEEVADALRLFACYLPVSCLTGVMIGYFTGVGRIGTLAVVEVLEQGCSILCTIVLLTHWAGTDPVRSCMAVILGSSLAGCVTLISLAVLRLPDKDSKGPRIPMAKRLAKTALPLAVADDLRTGISTAENLMVPRRLALYPGTSSALAAFGTVCGMVFPVLMFPAALLFGLTELLIPELSRCRAAGSTERVTHLVTKGLRFALLYGALCAGILFLIARELGDALYKSSESGEYLLWFSPLAVLLYCDIVTDAMIKGLGQQTYSVRYNILTNCMDVTLLYFLLPMYGIFGYFVSFLVTHVVNFILSLGRLLKIVPIKLRLWEAVKSILVTVISVCLAGFIQPAWCRVAIFLAVQVCLLRISGLISMEDLPIGRKNVTLQ